MASENSSLLLDKFSMTSYPGYAANESVSEDSPRAVPDLSDLTVSVNDPGNNPRNYDIETSRAILLALENATEYMRAQVEVAESQSVGNNTTHNKRKRRPLLPSWLTNYVLVITFLIQVVSVGMLEVFHAIKALNFNASSPNVSETDVIIVNIGDAFLCILELAHLIVVVLVSFKLAKQVLHHTASGTFLAQCYLSTVLLFAGLYTLEFRFLDSAWQNTNLTNENHPILVFLRMLYFSVSTATLCVFKTPTDLISLLSKGDASSSSMDLSFPYRTSTVEPVLWFAYLTSGVQMLLSFVYFASILSFSILPRKKSKFARATRERSLTNRIRKIFGGICAYWKE